MVHTRLSVVSNVKGKSPSKLFFSNTWEPTQRKNHIAVNIVKKASTISSALTRHALKAHNVITSIWTEIININFDIHLWKLNVILILNYDLEGLWILGSPARWKEGVRFPFISVNLFGRSGYGKSEQTFRPTGPCQCYWICEIRARSMLHS